MAWLCKALILTLLSSAVLADECSNDGSSGDLTFAYTSDNDDMNHFVEVTTNGCPLHAYGGDTAITQDIDPFHLPKVPHFRSTHHGTYNDHTQTVSSPIGFLLNGALLFGPAAAGGGAFAADCCGGWTDGQGLHRYLYDQVPTCLVEAGTSPGEAHSPLIGFLADGFPVYGPHGDDGAAPADLDACGGHHGDAGAGGGYHYHLTGTPDPGDGALGWFGACLRGCAPEINPHGSKLVMESILKCMREGKLVPSGDYVGDLDVSTDFSSVTCDAADDDATTEDDGSDGSSSLPAFYTTSDTDP